MKIKVMKDNLHILQTVNLFPEKLEISWQSEI